MKNSKLTIALVVFILGLLPKSWADCPTPAQLEAYGITPNSAVLSWEASPDTYKYEVRVKSGPIVEWPTL